MSWEQFDKERVSTAAKRTASFLNVRMLHFFENCVSCGDCEVNCPFTTLGEGYGPVSKAEPLRYIYRREYNILPRIFPWLFDAKLPRSKEDLDRWVDLAYHCTNCGLCYSTCPFGIYSGEMITELRGFLLQAGRVPSLLKLMIDAETSGTPLESPGFKQVWDSAISKVFEVAKVELDERGAKYLYLPFLAEAMITPGAVISTAKILSRLGVDWTMPSKPLSIRAPLGKLAGDHESIATTTKRLYDYIKSIGPEYVILSDGGYPYAFFRFELPGVVNEKPSFQALHLAEMLVDALHQNKLKIKQTSERITWHAPCAMVRFGGLIDEPAEVLSRVSTGFVKLKSHGLFSRCCGGGNGIAWVVPPAQEMMEKLMGAKLEITPTEKSFLDRLHRDMFIAGREKVQEIKESGATTVITACVDCFLTLSNTTKAYGVNVTLKTLAEAVAENME
jgi:Fe-S oxidoreductase